MKTVSRLVLATGVALLVALSFTSDGEARQRGWGKPAGGVVCEGKKSCKTEWRGDQCTYVCTCKMPTTPNPPCQFKTWECSSQTVEDEYCPGQGGGKQDLDALLPGGRPSTF